MHGNSFLFSACILDLSLSLLNLLFCLHVLCRIFLESLTQRIDAISDELNVLLSIDLLFLCEALVNFQFVDFILVELLAFAWLALKFVKGMLFHKQDILLLCKSSLRIDNHVKLALDLLGLNFSQVRLLGDVTDACLDILKLFSALSLEDIVQLLVASEVLSLNLT